MATEGEHKERIGAVLGRCAREALTVSTLSHPNITRIVESGVDTASGSPYFAMELLSGEGIAVGAGAPRATLR